MGLGLPQTSEKARKALRAHRFKQLPRTLQPGRMPMTMTDILLASARSATSTAVSPVVEMARAPSPYSSSADVRAFACLPQRSTDVNDATIPRLQQQIRPNIPDSPQTTPAYMMVARFPAEFRSARRRLPATRFSPAVAISYLVRSDATDGRN